MPEIAARSICSSAPVGAEGVKAAQAEEIDTLPVIYVDLDEPSEKQLNLALNRISGEFDLEKLAAVLGDLEAAGADLGLTGDAATLLPLLLEELRKRP